MGWPSVFSATAGRMPARAKIGLATTQAPAVPACFPRACLSAARWPVDRAMAR